jgi:hypothetical protein
MTSLGVVGEKGYEIWALALDHPGQIAGKLEGLRTFGCAVAWDAQNEPVEAIAAFSRQLIDAGCAFVGFWGPGCERAHDIFDEEEVGDGSGPADTPVVMTTWHEKGSWPEALDFLMDLGTPAKGVTKQCNDLVVLSFGSTDWAAQAELHVARRRLRIVT